MSPLRFPDLRRPKGAARWGGPLRRLLALAAVACLAAAACGGSGRPEFSHTFQSADALAAEVLDALARKDAPHLQALALGEHEFRKWVWPRLPVSRPGVNVSFDYFWKDFAFKSRASLASTLHEFGGERFVLQRVEFLGETTDYGTFSVSRDAQLTVTDALGRQRTICVFGSVVQTGGRHKLFSYVVD
ncbi:MAG: hypothetical protein AB1806_00940 [Acidobacteriota bacterium]